MTRLSPYAPDAIRACVLDAYDDTVPLSALTGASRSRDTLYVEARTVLAYVLRDYGYGATAIGRIIGRNHATIIHSLNKLLTEDAEDMIDTVRDTLRERFQRSA